eukprot:gene12114-8338_t
MSQPQSSEAAPAVPVESLEEVKHQYYEEENIESAPPQPAAVQPKPAPAAKAKAAAMDAFNAHRVETWATYIEVDHPDTIHTELLQKLQEAFGLYKNRGMRCLLKMLDCVVLWAERSQASYAAGRDWRQAGNLYQGQLLLEALEDTMSEFVSRLGPYQVFQNQEKKREHLRPENYPQWKRTAENGKKADLTANASRCHADAAVESSSFLGTAPARSTRRRGMVDLAPSAQKTKKK